MGLRVDRGKTVPYAVWYCLDIVFGIIWLVEMGVKLNEEQWRYFCSWWNLLDVVLVGVSVMDVVLGTLNMQVSARKDSELREMMKKLSLLRMLRLLRLVVSCECSNGYGSSSAALLWHSQPLDGW